MKSSPVLSLSLLLLLASCSVAPEGTPEGDETLGSEDQAWEAESATEAGLSTHLWIVEHALAGLAGREDAASAKVVAFFGESACKAQWEQGLLDADFKAAYNDGWRDTNPGDSSAAQVLAGATWASHFYDPDTQANYQGDVTRTGRTRAASFVAKAEEAFAAGRTPDACYALGLALHYATDATQPMHAANFTAKDRALLLHSHIEHYAMDIQDRFAAPAPFADVAAYASPDDAFVGAARAAKALWPDLRASIGVAYEDHGFWCRAAYATWAFDKATCWKGDAGVDREVGRDLVTAQASTAAYLLALSARIPSSP